MSGEEESPSVQRGGGRGKWNGVVGITGLSPLFQHVAIEQRGSTLSVRDARFGESELYGGWVAMAAVFAGLLILGPPWAYLICPLVPIFGVGALLQLGHARSAVTWSADTGQFVIRRSSSFWKRTATVPPDELSVATPGSAGASDASLLREGHRALCLARGWSKGAAYAALAVAGILAEAQGKQAGEDLPFEWEPFRDFDDGRIENPRLMQVVRPNPDALVVKPTPLGRALQVLPLVLMFACWVGYITMEAVMETAGYLAYAAFAVSVVVVGGSAVLVMALFGGHTMELQRAKNRLRARAPRQCGRALLDLPLSSVAAVRLAPRAGHGYDLDLILIRPRQLRVHVLALAEEEPLRDLGQQISEFLSVPLLG